MAALREFQVDFPSKAPIKCQSRASCDQSLQETPALIFTHGSGGDLNAPAIVNFSCGFANVSPIVCFHGNMNLPSRVKMFGAVCNNQGFVKCLGGRSMGARAAVMTVAEDTTHLVLISYPLHTNKETRDQILLDLPASVKIIFVSGDRDAMCELGRLKEVRKKMKCETWMVAVQDFDHGMNLKPKSEEGTRSVGRIIGEVVAKWLEGFDKGSKEASLSWDADGHKVQWSGWEIGIESDRNSGGDCPAFEATSSSTKIVKEEKKTTREDATSEKTKEDEVQVTKTNKKRRNSNREKAKAATSEPAKKVRR